MPLRTSENSKKACNRPIPDVDCQKSPCIFNLSRYAENGALFSELFTAALRENGTLCLAVNRHLEADEYDDDPDDFVRVVLGCPDNDLRLEPDDNIIALVQFDHLKEKTE